jgi:hypothetical protein
LVECSSAPRHAEQEPHIETRTAMKLLPLSHVGDDPDLAALYAYWVRQRGSRKMPSRGDIRPKAIVSLLPQLFLVDIFQPLRFRFRLVGSTICQRWHDDFTGKWLDELAFDGELETILEQFGSVSRTGMPRADIEEFVNEDDRYLHYYRLLLPLSEGESAPNMIIGIQKAIGIDGYKVNAPKWV